MKTKPTPANPRNPVPDWRDRYTKREMVGYLSRNTRHLELMGGPGDGEIAEFTPKDVSPAGFYECGYRTIVNMKQYGNHQYIEGDDGRMHHVPGFNDLE